MKKLSKKEWVAVVVASVFVAYALFGGHIINLFQATNTMSEMQMQISTLAKILGQRVE